MCHGLCLMKYTYLSLLSKSIPKSILLTWYVTPFLAEMPQNVRPILTIWEDKDIGELAKIADKMLETMDAAIAPWTAIWRSTSRVLPISSPLWKLSSQGKVPCSLAHLLNVCWSCLQCWTVKEKPTTATNYLPSMAFVSTLALWSLLFLKQFDLKLQAENSLIPTKTC